MLSSSRAVGEAEHDRPAAVGRGGLKSNFVVCARASSFYSVVVRGSGGVKCTQLAGIMARRTGVDSICLRI